MKTYRKMGWLVMLFLLAMTAGTWIVEAESGVGNALKKWQAGVGWGWVWGENDEVGSLNEMTNASRMAALQSVSTGTVYDLGILYDRNSFKWPGHSPGEIMAFRTPEGTKRQADTDFVPIDGLGTSWHSCALFMNDNVATQIDSLGHATMSDDNHWYNGYREEDWGGDWGPRKCDASTIPPVIARGVMIDVASYVGKEVLPANYAITVDDLQGALKQQGTVLRPGDVVLVRTGTLKFWDETGADHELIGEHDSAGITLESAKWLVEQQGAMMVGSDTSGLEWKPSAEEQEAYAAKYKSFMPVHTYLLIEQGVHIAEFHYLEELAEQKIFDFCYICTTAKIKGTTAGFALRPIAVQ
ncbi:MAG: cyclase family protein [Pirellulaceae bacterium]|nr:cyclase family protein [Pirellulaceae bacterium]